MKTLKIASTLACAVAGTLLCTSAMAATTLRVTTWLPPTNPQNAVVWPTWAKWVEEATEGRVKVEIEQGSGHPKTLFNLVEDGVTDVSFSVNGYLPGRFKLPGVVEIPGETPDAELGSVALWKVYKEYFEPADEFAGLSKEDQDAIMSVSGAKLSQLAGQAWGAADLAGYKEAQDSGKTIVRLTADDPLVGQLNDAIKGMDEAWIDSVADRGIDARAALNKYRELVSRQ